MTKEESYKKDIIAFWLDVVNDEEVETNTRLRASENLAKAYKIFDEASEQKDTSININFKEI